MSSKTLTVLLVCTAVVIFYWITIGFVSRKKWSARGKVPLIGFLFTFPYLIPLFVGGNSGPGSIIVVLFPIVAIIIGYIIGLIIDLSKKNKE